MVRSGGAVDGTLIKWAREQRELTLRQVLELDGPSIGFQSEVENGRKSEVSTKLLSRWVEILGVTVAFARGLVPCYNKTPAACRGLAGEVLSHVVAMKADWLSVDPIQRVNKVLGLIVCRLPSMPPAVLAHALGLEVKTLEQYISGEFVPPSQLVTALMHLTTLSETFFEDGKLEPMDKEDDYSGATALAKSHGISPEQLENIIRESGRQQPSNRPQPPDHPSDR